MYGEHIFVLFVGSILNHTVISSSLVQGFSNISVFVFLFLYISQPLKSLSPLVGTVVISIGSQTDSCAPFSATARAAEALCVGGTIRAAAPQHRAGREYRLFNAYSLIRLL